MWYSGDPCTQDTQMSSYKLVMAKTLISQGDTHEWECSSLELIYCGGKWQFQRKLLTFDIHNTYIDESVDGIIEIRMECFSAAGLVRTIVTIKLSQKTFINCFVSLHNNMLDGHKFLNRVMGVPIFIIRSCSPGPAYVPIQKFLWWEVDCVLNVVMAVILNLKF